ncbi:bifunctional metallophosphatase/5'-nucleotidase [Aurantiacibacter gangjinensis]|uniref:Uncharacterized protein n=1 Tax=Aurantiacibacter gangjinensis TaxID=502682 RepID=A0A0G9MWR4_9SPHN|nr:bifunctional metallophosphatase/5'-nucleotidase [Aurantiacibacter gangjinensis]APE26872.1 5'-nucleotidase [Aurantiacibacter gangjinensis]KLE33703.1 hypothetical protein AAW01_05215 [Aurantiacibacter gangjinensis]
MNTRLLAALATGTALAGCVHADLPESASAPVEFQILALNDFHGHLELPARPESFLDGDDLREARLGGAAQLAATLSALREENSVTIAAGDLIGASPLISALFLDEPTIAALNVAGLDIASVGNHEFDRGTQELRRIQDGGCEQYTARQPCAVEPYGGADFQYLAGNVVGENGETFFPGTSMRDIGGMQVGFIGLTLKDTPNLVADSATAGYAFLDEAQTANALAADLTARGADTVVLIIHEGAYGPQRHTLGACPQLSGPLVPIVEQLNASISVVASGHTHNSYVCRVDSADGAPRILTSAGRYGAFVTDIALTFDREAGRITTLSGENIPVDARHGDDAEAGAIVARYAEAVGPVANRAVGTIAGEQVFGPDCGDTPAQGFLADSYLFAANSAADETEVDFALVNSGGVRADLSSADDGVLTYGELAAMAPFSNTLMAQRFSGEQVLRLLEQQVCEEGGVVGRCDSALIPSANFRYAFDLSQPAGERVTSALLDGEPIVPEDSYVIVTNNFLQGGGDGFSVFTEAPVLANFGVDLDWLEAYAASAPLQVPVCGRVRGIDADI